MAASESFSPFGNNSMEGMKRNWLPLIAASASLICGTACSTRANPAKIRKEYAAVAAALKPHSDGFFIDESPEASALLDLEWSLQEAWVTAYLEDHPSATAKQIEGSVSDLGANLQGGDPAGPRLVRHRNPGG